MSFDVSKFYYLFFILIFNQTFAEDIIVITADRIKTELSKNTQDVKVISEENIKSSHSSSLPDLLKSQSDINIVTSGSSGSTASIFFRGTDSSHTLFVIDGIVMNDPSNPNRQFDIGKFSLSNIEKIEILKGSQSLAWGSNAIGAVVSITTKKNSKQKSLYFEAGTHETANLGSNFIFGNDKIKSTLAFDYFSTKGFSSADEKYNSYAEKDGEKRLTLDSSLHLNFLGNSKALMTIRYVTDDVDLDKGGGPSQDDPNDSLRSQQIFSKVTINSILNDNSESDISYSVNSQKRWTDISYDSNHPSASTSKNSGILNAVTLNHTIYFNDNFKQAYTVSYDDEKDQSSNSNQNISFFNYNSFEKNDWLFNLGARVDHNKFFNDHFTFKASSGYKDKLFYKFSIATGFKAPSLNQLYDPTYGNKSLTPEKSLSIDFSIENTDSKKIKSTHSIFYTKLFNRFSYYPVSYINRNAGKAEIIGTTEDFTLNYDDHFTHELSFTLLSAKDAESKMKLARRPSFKATNDLIFPISLKHKINFEQVYTSSSKDVDNNGNRVDLNSYFVCNLNYSYVANSSEDFFLKIKNIFNNKYEEIYGYGTGGIIASIGYKYNY